MAEAGVYLSISSKIWPPTQRTRGEVVLRLFESLTSHSILPKSYSVLPEEEATSVARTIEEQAFFVASAASATGKADDDDGMEVLRIYSNEISKRVMKSAKERTAASASALQS